MSGSLLVDLERIVDRGFADVLAGIATAVPANSDYFFSFIISKATAAEKVCSGAVSSEVRLY